MCDVCCVCVMCYVPCAGVQLATLSSLAPDRKADFAAVVVRAFVSGSAACLLTACVAGSLYSPASDLQ